MRAHGINITYRLQSPERAQRVAQLLARIDGLVIGIDEAFIRLESAEQGIDFDHFILLFAELQHADEVRGILSFTAVAYTPSGGVQYCTVQSRHIKGDNTSATVVLGSNNYIASVLVCRLGEEPIQVASCSFPYFGMGKYVCYNSEIEHSVH